MDKEYRQLLEDKTIACSPSNSGAALQLVMAHAVSAAKNPKTENLSKKPTNRAVKRNMATRASLPSSLLINPSTRT